MRSLLSRRLFVLVSVMLVTVLWLSATHAADAPAPLDRKEQDEQIYKTLRDVINKGADLYNSGDQNGCYRLYEGALLALQPLVDHHPEWQKAIATGIEDARRNPALDRRAFVLREVLDKIRNDVHPKKPEEPAKTPGDTGKKSLWDRLGGDAGVKQVVDDFVETAAVDTKVNFTRGDKYNLDEAKVKHLKQMLVEWISANTGGPIKKYTGKDMKTAHMDMGITDSEFNALAADLDKALRKNRVNPDDAKALLTLVESTRKDIVEKKEDKKDESKKDDEKGVRVTGKVTFNGKPLTEGEVSFHPANGKPFTKLINWDGTYELPAVTPGDYKITIDHFAIPVKYRDPTKSGLKLTVGAENQDHDINLLP
jgi:truncated hemoglobin YjbI